MLKRVTERLKGRARQSLPPSELRMGGAHFQDDDVFVRTAIDDVKRLERHGLSPKSRLLDWGCGAGRLAVGVREHWGRIDLYHGVDVQKELIDWAKKNLTAPGFEFTFVDIANARYNQGGRPDRAIPGETGDYDALYAYSVFSHMGAEESRPYLHEIRRLLGDDGFAFFTAFVEDDVEPEAENPAGYGPLDWSGPLHCVRFERGFFEGMIADAGLAVTEFEHGKETDGQSMYIVRPAQS